MFNNVELNSILKLLVDLIKSYIAKGVYIFEDNIEKKYD